MVQIAYVLAIAMRILSSNDCLKFACEHLVSDTEMFLLISSDITKTIKEFFLSKDTRR